MKESTTNIIKELMGRYPILEGQRDNIVLAYEIIKKCYEDGGKLLIGGNGGSCADSGHIVGELMKSFVKKRPVLPEFVDELKRIDPPNCDLLVRSLEGALPAIDITGHNPLNTAFGNDVEGGPLIAMAQQVYGYGRPKDVLLGISTSGNSRNLLLAVSVAKARGLKAIGLTGRDGGKLAEMANCSIIVPENETYKIQELHLPVYHSLCRMLEDTFF